jgi:uncharacterized protein YecA (UPF0149 family)
MGAIAEAMSRFAQPLIDASDGSPEELQRALSLSQLCWNLALLPEEKRDAFMAKMQPARNIDDGAFQELKREVILPMIERHAQMFPGLHQGSRMTPAQLSATQPVQGASAPRVRSVKKYPGTGRNEPCPCGSGRKYKVCCGR